MLGIALAPGIVKGIKNKNPSKIVSMIPNGCDIKLTGSIDRK